MPCKLGLGSAAASLDVQDTGSTAQGAAAAAQKAIADGAGLIIGPLTDTEAGRHRTDHDARPCRRAVFDLRFE